VHDELDAAAALQRDLEIETAAGFVVADRAFVSDGNEEAFAANCALVGLSKWGHGLDELWTVRIRVSSFGAWTSCRSGCKMKREA
jgi:hypothetical protein